MPLPPPPGPRTGQGLWTSRGAELPTTLRASPKQELSCSRSSEPGAAGEGAEVTRSLPGCCQGGGRAAEAGCALYPHSSPCTVPERLAGALFPATPASAHTRGMQEAIAVMAGQHCRATASAGASISSRSIMADPLSRWDIGFAGPGRRVGLLWGVLSAPLQLMTLGW